MKSVKFFLILTIFILSPFESFSHGPSRQKVSESIIVNASAETVWDIVKNFKDFKWNEDVKNCLATDNKIGSERTIEFNNGSKLKQKLEKLDDEKLMIGWRVTETDNKMLPVNSYAAKIFITSKDDNTAQVKYKAGFYRGFMGNDPPEELNDENSKKKVENFIKKSLNGLKKFAEN